MPIQKCTIAMLLPLCNWAQAPIDHRATVPAVIPDSVLLEANIPYDQYKETVLDILQPKEQSKEKRPGVILIHGGGWMNGTKEPTVSATPVPCCLLHSHWYRLVTRFPEYHHIQHCGALRLSSSMG
jgi:acetyl esterase/lipase